MNLEKLTNDILLYIFEYLDGLQILRAFYDLNDRINQLILKNIQHYNIDFRCVSKQYFDIFCKNYLPHVIDRVTSLHLCNDNNSPNLPNILFSYGFHLYEFNRLQSLQLYYISSMNLLHQIIKECVTLPYLNQLEMVDCYFLYEQNEIHELMHMIWNLHGLIYFKFNRPFSNGTWLKVLSGISSSLKSVSLEETECCFTDLLSLFQYTPNLRYLSTSMTSSFEDKPFPITNLLITSLKLVYHGSSVAIVNLFRIVKNLRHLTIHMTSFHMNGHEWENVLLVYLSKLKTFHLKMDLHYPKYYRQEDEIDEFLNTFRTKFWITTRQWFVRYDWNASDVIGYGTLYTLPYVFREFIYTYPYQSKSTCADDRNSSSYDFVKTFTQKYDKNDLARCSTLLSSQFPSVQHLEISLPFTSRLLSIIPSFNNLTSLYIKISSSKLDCNQLQKIFDGAVHLRSLAIGVDNSMSIDLNLFTLRSLSIRSIEFVRKPRLTLQKLNDIEFDSFIHSSLASYCTMLTLSIENRTKIHTLIEAMSNLQSLTVTCEDDSFDSIESSSANDELIDWLHSTLPSTFSITRDCERGSIRLWISR